MVHQTNDILDEPMISFTELRRQAWLVAVEYQRIKDQMKQHFNNEDFRSLVFLDEESSMMVGALATYMVLLDEDWS